MQQDQCDWDLSYVIATYFRALYDSETKDQRQIKRWRKQVTAAIKHAKQFTLVIEPSLLQVFMYLKSWTKVLDKFTFRALFIHAKQTVTREFIYTCSALPHLKCTHFSRVSTLYWGGGKAKHFEADNSAFLKLRFKSTEN